MNKFIQPATPTNWEAKRAIPLWVPHRIHHNKGKVACKMQQQILLRGYGIESLGDILNTNGGIFSWQQIQHRLLENCHRAYENLTSNLLIDGAQVIPHPGSSPFYAQIRLEGRQGMVWKFSMDRRLQKNTIRTTMEAPIPSKSYSNSLDILSPTNLAPIPKGSFVTRTIVGLPQIDKAGSL